MNYQADKTGKEINLSLSNLDKLSCMTIDNIFKKILLYSNDFKQYVVQAPLPNIFIPLFIHSFSGYILSAYYTYAKGL